MDVVVVVFVVVVVVLLEGLETASRIQGTVKTIRVIT